MNLLPQEYKKALKLEAWQRYALYGGMYLGLVMLVGVVFLLPSFFFLQLQIGEMERRLQVAQRRDDYVRMTQGKSVIDETNKVLRSMTSVQKRAKAVTPIVEDFLRRVPTGVTLSAITLTREQGKPPALTISGIAADRDALTDFQKALQESTYVKEKIEIPPTSYIAETNINFTLAFPVVL